MQAASAQLADLHEQGEKDDWDELMEDDEQPQQAPQSMQSRAAGIAFDSDEEKKGVDRKKKAKKVAQTAILKPSTPSACESTTATGSVSASRALADGRDGASSTGSKQKTSIAMLDEEMKFVAEKSASVGQGASLKSLESLKVANFLADGSGDERTLSSYIRGVRHLDFDSEASVIASLSISRLLILKAVWCFSNWYINWQYLGPSYYK